MDTSDFSKILVKYLRRSSLFVNLQANSLELYQKKSSFRVVFEGLSLLCIFSLGTHLNGCFRNSAFTLLFNANKKKSINENKQLVS